MGPRTSKPAARAGALALLLAACVGEVGSANAPGAEEPTSDDPNSIPPGGATPTSFDLTCNGADLAPTPIRRLTPTEYENSVRDLFEGAKWAGGGTFADVPSVTELVADQLMEASERIAASAAENLPAILPCDPARAGAAACAQQFIRVFGRRAYRRPITDVEAVRLEAVFAVGVKESFAAGIELVVQTMLQSPSFLYRAELGAGPAAAARLAALSPHETAARLSYFLWRSMPDAELFAAADQGQLATKDQVAAQVRRMMKDPRARAAVASFHEEWLRLNEIESLDKDKTAFPIFNEGLRSALEAHTARFIDHVIWEGDGKLSTLFGASFAFLNKSLATLYGVMGPSGSALERVSLSPMQRSGLLTDAGLLALHASPAATSPIQRGVFVRKQLLCQALPDPPPGADPLPPPNPMDTERQRLMRHRSDPSCGACHALIDPIGLGFENYDGIGRWRTKEAGLPVNAAGELTGTDVDGPFSGAVALAQKLATGETVRTCVMSRWFELANGRPPGQADACAMRSLKAAFAASDSNIPELIVALVQTDSFRYLKVPQGVSR